MRSDIKLRTIEAGAQRGGIKYTFVGTTPYNIDLNDVVMGTNIYGIDAGSAAIINVPQTADPTDIIHIQNESATFNVTINFI